MRTDYRQIFALMTRVERERFEQMGGVIPRDIRTCMPEWYVPTRKDRVADEERLRKNRTQAKSKQRNPSHNRRTDGAKKRAA